MTKSHCSKLKKRKQISRKVGDCQEMIQCHGKSKIILKYTSRKQRGRQISGDVSFMMMRVYTDDVEWTTPQSREYIPTLSYWCPFFFSLPFGSCQRSTSNSTRWNHALLSMSHWCIARPGRSRLCKHTLSKPIEDARRRPHPSFTVYLRGGGHAVTEDKFVAAITFLLQMKRVKQSRAAEPGVSTIILHCLKWSMS